MSELMWLKWVRQGDRVFSTHWGWLTVSNILDAQQNGERIYTLSNGYYATESGRLIHAPDELPSVFRTVEDAQEFLRHFNYMRYMGYAARG